MACKIQGTVNFIDVTGTLSSIPAEGNVQSCLLLLRAFLALTDTPDNYIGQAGKVVGVNGAEDGLEFITVNSATWGNISGTLSDQVDLQSELDNKQETLVSGTNLKSINSESLLGSGDIAISASPNGNNTEIQFNNSGSFGASSDLIWNDTTKDLRINGDINIRANDRIYLNNFDYIFSNTPGQSRFTSPFTQRVTFESQQSGQSAQFVLETAENKTASIIHFDVANALGRLLSVQTQPGVQIRISPSENEMLRFNGFGVRDVTSTASWVISSWATSETPLTIKGITSQTANLLEIQDSSSTVLSAFDLKGAWQPPSLDDGSANNNSVYYSTTQSRLVYKDSGGTINNLY